MDLEAEEAEEAEAEFEMERRGGRGFPLQYLPDSGSSEMKSTLMTSQHSSGIGSGWSSPVGRRRCILVQRNKSQWETYMPTYRDMFGHQ